jgi:hypothetical protein
LGPPQNSEFALAADNNLIFTWNWPEPLTPDQRFAIYLKSARTFQIGAVYEPQSDTQYQYKVTVSDIPVAPEIYEWQVKLEDSSQGLVLWESQSWSIRFLDQNEALFPSTPTLIPTPSPEPPSDS